MRSASVSSAPTSEPPAFSVMSCAPFIMWAGSWLSSRSIRRRFSSGEAWVFIVKFDVSDIETGHISPNSPCTKR